MVTTGVIVAYLLGASKDGSGDIASAGREEHAGTLLERGAGGHDIVDEYNFYVFGQCAAQDYCAIKLPKTLGTLFARLADLVDALE